MDLLTRTLKWMRETVRTEVQMLVRDTGYTKEAQGIFLMNARRFLNKTEEPELLIASNRYVKTCGVVIMRKLASRAYPASSKACRPH